MADSKDTQVSIVKYLINNSPIGEVLYVKDDIKKLVPSYDRKLLDQHIKNFYEENFAFFTGKNKTVITTKNFKDENDGYIDPKTNSSNKVDFDKGTISKSSSLKKTPNAEIEKLRKSVEDGLLTYASNRYKKGKFAAKVFANNDGIIVIAISAKNLNMKNFWGGDWRSIYSINVKENKLMGKLNSNMHYFEDGNLQFNSKILKDFSVDCSNEKSIKDSVINTIEKMESNYTDSVDKFLDDLNEDAFKALRRFLPLTKTKMDWNFEQSLSHSVR